MARGKDRHNAQQRALQLLGKPLSRRAKSRCELCGAQRPLRVVEVAGSPLEHPVPEWAVMICESCESIDTAAVQEPNALRFLETAMWSETQPAQILAVRNLQGLAKAGVSWAQEALDSLYLSDEIASLL